jgi:protein-disulfide isomerase
MDEENKPTEAADESKPADDKKENILVVKKSKLIIIIALVIIVASAIIVYRLFFSNSSNGKVEYIASFSPVLGNSNATVNVIEFSDYECPYCQASEGTNQDVISRLKEGDSTWEAPIPSVIEQYVNTGKVKLVFRNFPLHTDSKGAALAAYCAQEQGKFWEYHQNLFKNYDALTKTDLEKYAADTNLNLSQFNDCLNSNKYENYVQNDMSDGDALGVSGTPTFFIGNNETGYEKIVGAESFSVFKQIIESKISV